MTPEDVVAAATLPLPAIPRYPVRLHVAFDQSLSRLRTAFRLPLLLPVYFVLSTLGLLVPPAVLAARGAILLRRKHPDWLFQFNAGYLAYLARFEAYALLLTDRYPSFSQEAGGPVFLEIAAPAPGHWSRWRGILWRLALIGPHMVVLGALWWALFAVTIIASFAVFVTGRYPEGLFEFSAGVIRWQTRVAAYLMLLTDDFPPYALADDTARASRRGAIASGVPGVVLGGGFAALVIVAIIAGPSPERVEVDYEALQSGRSTSVRSFDGGSYVLTLVRVHDPGQGVVRGISAPPGERIVVVEWGIANDHSSPVVPGNGVRLEYRDGDRTTWVRPTAVSIEIERVPGDREELRYLAVFPMPPVAEPVRLRVSRSALAFLPLGGLEYRFE